MRLPPGPCLGLAALVAGCTPPAGGTLYVTSGFEDRVYLLEAGAGSVLDTISLDRRIDEVDEPHGVAVDAERGFWYATLAHGDPTLWKHELGSNRVVGRVALPQPGASRIGLSPDGSRGLVPDYYRGKAAEPSTLSVVDLVRMEVLATHSICTAPHDAQFHPSGRRVAVACALGDEIVLFDPSSPRIELRIPVPPSEEGARARPMNVVWDRTGSRLYATLMGQNRVLVVDGTSGDVLGSIPTGGGPGQIALSPDGALMATANRSSGSVSLIDPLAMTERRRVDLPGDHPHGIAFDASGETVFVTYEGTTRSGGGVIALNRAGRLLWQTPVGNFTLGVAYAPPSPAGGVIPPGAP